MAKVRLGFVGVGGMGQCAHLRNYVTLPDCEVAAIAELREGLGRRVAERYAIPGVYRDHRELLANERLDGIVAMYHDQGHIALKLLGRGRAVNISAGLPIVRTSVAHGTAYDIAGRGCADADSLVEATRIAALLSKSKKVGGTT